MMRRIQAGRSGWAYFVIAMTCAVFPRSISAEQYIELPMRGQIGGDVSPKLVRDVLTYAVKHEVQHVVMRIDTPGGFVPPAEGIWNTLHEFDDALTYHVIIDKCISAGVWVPFASDTLHMTPEAIWGAASVYDTLSDQTTKLNEKSSSIFAAQIAARAGRRGFSPALVRGMIVPGSELWSWTDSQGQRQLTAYRPDPGHHSSLVQLDSPTTLLTLTATEAEAAGIAPLLHGGAAELGKSLGYESWQRYSGYGVAKAIYARYRHNLSDFTQFNKNLKADTSLLSWTDSRTHSDVPSLFGKPKPGLEPAEADRIFTAMRERLDAAFNHAVAMDADLISEEGKPSPDMHAQRAACESAWRELEAVVISIEAEYRELTGREVNLNFLKPWPLEEIKASWAAQDTSALKP